MKEKTAYYSKQAKTMLDYLYRIKKKKRVKPVMFFFFSINKQHLFLCRFKQKGSFLFLRRPPALKPVYKIPL